MCCAGATVATAMRECENSDDDSRRPAFEQPLGGSGFSPSHPMMHQKVFRKDKRMATITINVPLNTKLQPLNVDGFERTNAPSGSE